MIVQLWNTNTSAFVSFDADLAENYMYISMKFGTGVHVFCWEVGVFNRSSFQSVSYNWGTNIPTCAKQYAPPSSIEGGGGVIIVLAHVCISYSVHVITENCKQFHKWQHKMMV